MSFIKTKYTIVAIFSILCLQPLTFGCQENPPEPGNDHGSQGNNEQKPNPNQPNEGNQNPGGNGNTPGQNEDPKKPPGGSQGIIPGDDDPDEEKPTQPGQKPQEILSLISVTPSTGSLEGGGAIRVIGAGFQDDAIVRFGQVPSPDVVFGSSSRLSAEIPPGRYGCVDIFVDSGSKTVNLPSAFCYTESMTLEDINPKRVPVGSIAEFELTGSGFHLPLAITIGGENVEDFQVTSENTIRGVFPQHPEGLVDIRVVSEHDHGVLTEIVQYYASPKVENIQPSYIPVGKNTEITLLGNALEEIESIMIGSSFAKILEKTEKKVTLEAPNLESGEWDVLIMTANTQQRIQNGVVYYKPSNITQLFKISPSCSLTTGNSEAFLEGQNLSQTTSVKIGNQQAEILDKLSHFIQVKVPPSQPGRFDVSIEGANKLTNAFQYVTPMTITSMEPTSGSHSGNTLVRLNGEGFTQNLEVRVGEEVAKIVHIDDTSIEFYTPPGGGAVSVNLSDGCQTVIAPKPYQYHANLSVLGLSPSESPITGGVGISVKGSGFTPQTQLYMDGKLVENTQFVDNNLIEFVTEPHEVGEVLLTLKRENEVIELPKMLQFYDPGGLYTSSSGGNVAGTVNVTVLTVGQSEPIPNAEVQIGVDAETSLKGITNEAGMVSFHDTCLQGPQYVFACAETYSCTSMQPVNGKNIILYLEDLKEKNIDINIDIEDIIDDFDPNEINPIKPVDVTQPVENKQAFISGKVTGFDKIELASDPDMVKAAFVLQSQLGTYSNNSITEGEIRYIFDEGGTYRLKSRNGELAMAVLCGMYNQKTKAFDPRFIGVKRFIVVTEGVDQTVDLSCNLPLNQTQAIKLLDAPMNSGPNVVRSQAYLFLGNEGFIGGFMNAESKNDLVIVTKMPPLRDAIQAGSFAFSTGVYTNYGAPYTTVYTYEYVPNGSILEQGPVTATPVFITPNTENILETGHIAWSVENQRNVDYYSVIIREIADYKYSDIWQFYLPGTATSLDFPPMTINYDKYTNYSIYVGVTAYTSVFNGYDFNYFSTMDLRSGYIKSSAYNYMNIRVKPKPENNN